MLNELIQLFTSNANQSSELLYNATIQLNEFLNSTEVVKCFPKVAENLGDQLPNLRKASHQLFQAFIRQNETFDPVLQAILNRGIVHPNWCVRQKNANSLQSLILSEGRHLQPTSNLARLLVEVLLNKLSDPSVVVCKATEQTLISLVSLPQFNKCFAGLQYQVQHQLEQFVEQMKMSNQLRGDLRLKETIPINNLPFDNLQDLQDSQWQMRSEAIQNIHGQLQNLVLTPLQVELLFEHIVGLLNDHNFNIVLTTLQIMLRCMQFNIVKSAHMKEVQSKLGDSKSAVRGAVRQVLVIYLQKIGDGDLFVQLMREPNKNSSYKDELLDLVADLTQRNKMLLQQHLELVIREIAPFLEEQKPKLKQKACDTLTLVTALNPQASKRILQQLGCEDFCVQIDVSTASSNKSDFPIKSRITQTTQITQNDSNQSEGYVPTMITQPQKQQRSAQKPNDSHPQSSSVEFRQQQQQIQQPPLTQQSKPFRVVKNPQIDDADTGLTFTKPFQRKGKGESDKTCQPVYLDDVTPLDQPEQVLKNLLTDLRYDEWSRQFDGLNNLRRLAKHHTDLLRKSPSFVPILQEMVKQMENLRSGVSKNALISMQELCEIYKTQMDCVLELGLQKLIKKAIDLNTFIIDEVRKATVSLLTQCTESKCISLICQVYQSKSAAVKINLCHAINQLINPQKPYFEKIVQFLCVYACDQGQEVRQVAKEGLLGLASTIPKYELDQLIVRHSPEGESKRVLTMLNGEMTATSDFRKFGNTTQEARTPEMRNRTPNKKVSAEFEQMPNYMNIAESTKDWKQKKEAIDWLCAFSRKEAVSMNGHKYSVKFLDLMCKLINDGNTKIALHACEQFNQLVEPLKLPIQNNHINVWNGVFATISSANNAVRQSAELLFLELMTHIDILYSLPQISHLILFGPGKSKGTAISMLANFVPTFYQEKPQLVVKHLVPLAKKLQDEQKPDIKLASQKMFQALVSTCPGDVAHLKLLK